MPTARRLLLALATALSISAPAAAQAPPNTAPWIPGLPVPVFMPANFPWGVLVKGAPMPQQPLPGQPAQGQPAQGQPVGQLPAPPAGSFDGNGYLTVPFMQAESTQMIRDLVANLQPARKAKVDGIPLMFDLQTSEFNAFAGCDNGVSFMAVTGPLMRTMGHISEAKAADEVFGTRKVDAYTRMAADALKTDQPVPDPPPGFYTQNEALDPRKLSRQRVIFDEMIGFVLGHELAHHYLGHTGCANGDRGRLDPTAIPRIISNVVPAANQVQEASSDTAGVQNLLDTGAAKGTGYTEMGGVLTLQFFGTLSQLTPGSLLLGVLRTHPAPQLRIPLVQSTAQQWRAGHRTGVPQQTAPGGLPFPIPLPFPFSIGG